MASYIGRKRLISIATFAALIAAAVAYAYFTSTGTGSGTAAVGTDSGVTVTDVTFDDTLYPGATVGVSFNVNNPSTDSPVKVGQIIADVSAGTNGITGLPTGCSAADFTYTPGTALNAEIAASSTTAGSGTLTMADTSVNQDACKNASPVLHLIVDNSALA